MFTGPDIAPRAPDPFLISREPLGTSYLWIEVPVKGRRLKGRRLKVAVTFEDGRDLTIAERYLLGVGIEAVLSAVDQIDQRRRRLRRGGRSRKRARPKKGR